MRFTDLTAAIRAQAQVSAKDAEAIAKGLITRGLIKGDVVPEPRPCECCGKPFYPDLRTARYCSAECVSHCEHL